MSESVIQTVKPAEPARVFVTDSLGRRLGISKLTALRELDLIEAAGEHSENRRWMMMATLACCIDEIDGIPYPFSTNRTQVRSQVARVGSEGIEAVAKHFGGELPDDAADVNLAAAKN